MDERHKIRNKIDCPPVLKCQHMAGTAIKADFGIFWVILPDTDITGIQRHLQAQLRFQKFQLFRTVAFIGLYQRLTDNIQLANARAQRLNRLHISHSHSLCGQFSDRLRNPASKEARQQGAQQ